MAGIENVFKVLEFDKNNIQLYLNELTVWTMCAEVKRKKQGSLAWNSLPTVIKHFINDSIGMEDFNEDDGKTLHAEKNLFPHPHRPVPTTWRTRVIGLYRYLNYLSPIEPRPHPWVCQGLCPGSVLRLK